VSYEGDIQDLIGAARRLPHGKPQVATAEQAVRLADQHQDVDLGFAARMCLISSAVFSGAPEKAMVAFSWCVAKSDEEPERFPMLSNQWGTSLLWMYKWITNEHLASYPQITRAQIEHSLEDM